MNNEISVLIKAGGVGKRMNPITQGEIPKTMIEINGRPMLLRTSDMLARTGFENVAIVIRDNDQYTYEKVKDKQTILISSEVARQGNVKSVEEGIKTIPQSESRSVLIVTGDDSGFIQPETYQNLIQHYQKTGVDCTNRVAVINDKGEIKKYYIGDQPEDLHFYRQHYAHIGILVARKAWLDWFLPKIEPDPNNGELQLSRIFELASRSSRINILPIQNQLEWNSFNTPKEYKEMVIKARNFS